MKNGKKRKPSLQRAVVNVVKPYLSLNSPKNYNNVIEVLKKCLREETPVPEALQKRMRALLLQYAVVGGMPEAVQTFVDTNRPDKVLQIQRDIIRAYKDDMVKYADKKDKANIKECFQSISKQMSKENKKFQYSVVKKGQPLQNIREVSNGLRVRESSNAAIIFPLQNCLWTAMRKRMCSRSICVIVVFL